MQTDFSYGVVPIYKLPQDFEFLLIQHQAGHWGFPKGHAEGEESPEESASRELQEETGIVNFELIPDVYFEEEYYPKVDGEVVHKTVRYYLAWVSDKAVKMQEDEVQNYAWLRYKQAREQMTFAGGRKILREVGKYLAKDSVAANP